MEMEAKALEILTRDRVSNIDMSEGIKRGTMDVLYACNGTVLLRSKDGFLYMFLTDNVDEGRNALKGHTDMKLCVAHGMLSRDVIQEMTGLDYETPCRQFAYTSDKKPEMDERFTYRVLTASDAEYVKTHYAHGYEPDIDRALCAGRIIGAEYEGKLAGFIGMHGEGSVGMLEVDPAYRRLGIGTALEKYMFRRHMEKGHTAYGQVFVDNDGSLALQKSIGIEASKELIWWMFNEK